MLRYYPPPPTPQLLSTSWVLRGLDLIKSFVRPPVIPLVVHVDDFKLCPGPQDISWVPGVPTAKSLCASTVAFRPGSRVSDTTPDPSVDVSGWEDMNDLNTSSTVIQDLDRPI